MPKMKTHRGAAKRFKPTGTGRLKFKKPGHSHILTSKTRKVKRKQRQPAYAHDTEMKSLERLLPYIT
jgi:large subunit ribosomal protein L35